MPPESPKYPGSSSYSTDSKHSSINTLRTALFYLAILFFFIGFNFTDRMAGNWYQQFLPNIGSKQINDIIFLDSLTGFAIASRNVNPDTSSILRTTNGGDNWQIVVTYPQRRFSRVKFINSLTGFVSGGSGSGTPYLYKTVDGGNNWFVQSSFGCAYWSDMQVLSNDTIWLVDGDGLCGGAYRTTNGGGVWEQKFINSPNNPNHIYMYNSRIGFICRDNLYLRRTTNGGTTWDLITGATGFLDMHFADSLTGWKTSFQKTTNGGLNWVSQVLPQGGMILTSQILRFSNLNSDTIWGVGGTVFFGSGQFRGIVYRTQNGGDNWLFQIPDTAINISQYRFVKFSDRFSGWAYSTNPGVHTTSGGDPIWLTPLTQISAEVPKEFVLYQNYPNPFNPVTRIRYSIKPNLKSQTSKVKLVIYDITGKEISVMVDSEHKAGTYEVDFPAYGYSSGVYFYSLILDNLIIDTKKMLMIK